MSMTVDAALKEAMGVDIEDILITLGRQYHLIMPLSSRAGAGLFLYLAIDKTRANLALARHQLRTIADNIEL